MSRIKSHLFHSSISLVLIFQITVGTCFSTWPALFAADGALGASTEDQGSFPDLESEASARAAAKQTAQVFSGNSAEVRLRLDHFGLLDLERLEELSPTSIHESGLAAGFPDGNKIYNAYENLKETPGISKSHGAPASFTFYYQDHPLFRTRFNVKTVAFYGPYLVFIEPEMHSSGLPSAEGADHHHPDPEASGVQYVSFIDLRVYKSILGKSTPPLFTVPVAVNAPTSALKTGPNGELVLISSSGQEATVPLSLFETFSKMHQTLLDVTAALLNPKTYENAGPAVEGAAAYFLKTAESSAADIPEQARREAEFAKLMHERLQAQQRKIGIARQNIDLDQSLNQYQEALAQSVQHAESITALQESVAMQRKFFARLQLLWHRLSLPRPAEAPETVREALAMVAFGLQAEGEARTRALKEGGLGLLTKPIVKYGAGVAAAASLAILYPEQFSQFAYQALDIGGVILGGLLGRVRGSGILFGRATFITFSGLNPAVFYQAYLTPEKLPHFLIGITGLLGTFAALAGIPYLMVNSWLLARDLSAMNLPTYRQLREEGQSIREAGLNMLQAKVNGFIARERARSAESMRGQTASYAKMAAEHDQETALQYTQADTEEVQRILDELEAQNNSWVSKAFKKITVWKIFRRQYDVNIESDGSDDPRPSTGQNQSIVTEETLAERQILNFRDALAHFLFSYSSLTTAFEEFTNKWNGLTIFRKAAIHPTLWFIQLYYPNFIRSTLGDGTYDEQITPTKANGGLISRVESGRRILQMLTFDKDLEALRSWEKAIIPVEQAVTAVTVRAAYRALCQYIQADGGDLRELIRTGGLQGASDPRLAALSLKYRTFFRHFVDQLSSRVLRRVLINVAAQDPAQNLGDLDLEKDPDFRELKKQTLYAMEGIRAKAQDVDRITEEVAVSENVYDRAARIANSIANRSFSGAAQAALINLKSRALDIVDPKKDPTMASIKNVLKMMQRPDSMPRATRASLASLLIAKTVGLVMTLTTLAGVDSGVLKPLHDEMFGTESYFYLGRMSFVNGVLSGLLVTVFSSAWMKLQVDQVHAKDFGEVPEGEEAEWGFARWYYKHAFQNPKNNWWINQKNMLNIIRASVGPNLVMIAILNFLSLGRFDLDGYIIGNLTTCLSPFLGLAPKFGQALELASYHFLKNFPQRLRGHALVQKKLALHQQAQLIIFSICNYVFMDLYESTLGLFDRMSDSAFGGAEAASRLLLSGYTPTELVYKGLASAQRALGFIPGASRTIDFCTRLLTHNYKAASPDRIPLSKTK